MSPIRLEPTSQAQWYALVQEAIAANGVCVKEDLEHYLVLLLMRFMNNAHVFNHSVTLEYLKSHEALGPLRGDSLRDVGDKCLLFSGLFPQWAYTRERKASYYVTLGRQAYGTLGDLAHTDLNRFYSTLGENFVLLMDVLLATRRLQGAVYSLTPLEAEHLWYETGSQQARRMLEENCEDATLLEMFFKNFPHKAN